LSLPKIIAFAYLLENPCVFKLKKWIPGDFATWMRVQIPHPAPTTFFETNTPRLALFLFSEEFGVIPFGFFYF
jgi:hypothetical protein